MTIIRGTITLKTSAGFVTSNCVTDDLHNMHLMNAAVADSCVAADIGNFLIFHTALFCRGHTRQTQFV